MGNCVSSQDREAQLRSQEIDKQIEEDSRKFKKERKILLLGESSVRAWFISPYGSSRVTGPRLARLGRGWKHSEATHQENMLVSGVGHRSPLRSRKGVHTPTHSARPRNAYIRLAASVDTFLRLFPCHHTGSSPAPLPAPD